ncbi:carbohydrate-binding module family 18 protein [Lentithecium fluviatile CBS 122367]|uniref:chitinase n=1 Tax=Lentithecium fluviatile CBS 122367 TaxID=1168545 RepID=A0A6G1IGQ0_9PLEO|nr:carbohydrate-binding module family 18 protein [Lentithecium fluviatile CBS 122367]
MRFASTILAPLALVAMASARYVMYYDEWHPTSPTNAADRAGIDHLILAFAHANDTANYKPHVDISTIKSEFPEAKIMVAIGGWGDTKGFSDAVKSEAGIKKFASDVKTMIENTGIDGIDIDWEYPGGNGADYKETPNSEKANEIKSYPKLLAALRTAIGKDKVLSIAVPGKAGDMLAYTEETGPLIWPSVDFVNVMSYDLMNRRDDVTAHHTSIAGSTQSVNNYLDIGYPAEKLNLGFANYAKYFTTASDCNSSPLGCPIVPAEKPDGTDALNSGAYTFEKANMMSAANMTNLKVSTDGTCGPDKGKCASGCCSQYANCGTSPQHCSVACQVAFGTGCTGPDIAGSWQKALVDGTYDENEGGQYYFDTDNRLFWTWDTLDIMERKNAKIVQGLGLGGVMAWSLGEDSYDWSHVKTMAGFSRGAGYGVSLTKTPETEQTGSTPEQNEDTTAYDVVSVDGEGDEGDYAYEESCTRKRVRKRSAKAMPQVLRRRGHVRSRFLA